MSRKKKKHFFHWSVCTLYRPYHHFMNLKRKLAPAPPRSELISPSCGNSDVAMSGDKVTSLRGVLSGGWHCVTTPDAGCFVIFLPDCYSDVFMNGLETKNWTQMTGSQQRWRHNDGFHRVKEGEKQNVALKSSLSEASVSRWAFFFLSNANTVLWLSVRNLSIFRWCLSGWVSGPSPFSPHLSPVCWLAAESFLLAAEATILWRHGWRFTFLLRSSAERRFHTRRAGGHARAVMRSSAGVAYTYPARRRAAALQLQALPADFAQTYSTKRRAIESGKGSTRRLLFFAAVKSWICHLAKACFASVTSLGERPYRGNCLLRWAVNQKFATCRCIIFIFCVVLPLRFRNTKTDVRFSSFMNGTLNSLFIYPQI